MTHKIVEQAKKAKESGYTHIASIVKQHYASKYYHVVSIDRIIEAGRWIPAQHYQSPNGWHGPVGTISSEIDWDTTVRKATL